MLLAAGCSVRALKYPSTSLKLSTLPAESHDRPHPRLSPTRKEAPHGGHAQRRPRPHLARTHNVQEHTIGAVRRLLVDEQRTVPFVARYRAQETQHLPPDALRAILDALHGAAALEAKRQKVLEAMQSANASPEALSAARRAGTLRALDDAYAPFKGPAKCSKAAKAREDFPARSRRRLIGRVDGAGARQRRHRRFTHAGRRPRRRRHY